MRTTSDDHIRTGRPYAAMANSSSQTRQPCRQLSSSPVTCKKKSPHANQLQLKGGSRMAVPPCQTLADLSLLTC